MEPLVHIGAGSVRGRELDGVSAFKGIPYAAPLDGVRRFQAPRPVEAWDGVREAVRYSADPPQCSMMPGLPSPWRPGDATDALSVNVWTPDVGGSGLPVLVWLYGGAFLAGTSRQPGYDGTNLARGGVVVVSLNYRVGFEGFGWLPDQPHNRAFLDQLTALRWVQDNIARFGGDPGNVTVFGESAGGTAVAALTAADAGRGLFRRAIGQSIAGGFLSEDRARRTGERIAAALGVALTSEAFGEVPSEAIHAAQTVPGAITPFGPIVDGDLVTGHPWEHLRAEVDLIAGFNRDEYRLFAINEHLSTKDPAVTAQGLGQDIEAYRAAYPGLADPDLYVTMMSDAIFRVPTTLCAQNHPGRSWLYELTWPSPAFDGMLGCCHALDVPLTFGNFDGPLGGLILGGEPVPPDALMLSEVMRKAWTSFATTGDPGWPEYEPAERLARIWDTHITVESDPEGASRRIWAR